MKFRHWSALPLAALVAFSADLAAAQDGGKTTYTRDADGRLETVTTSEGTTGYSYYPDGEIRAVNHPDGRREAYDHDEILAARRLAARLGAEAAEGSSRGPARQDAGSATFASPLDQSRNRFAFTGYYFDSETGLYFAKARYYDPATGRFLTEDAYPGKIEEPASMHRYIYAHDNPTRYIDPNGHAVILPNDPQKRAELIAYLKLGVPRAGAAAIREVKGTGEDGLRKGEVYVDPAPFRGLKTDDRNLSRLQAIVISEKRTELNLASPSDRAVGMDPQTGKPIESDFSAPDGRVGLTMPRPSDLGAQAPVSRRADTSEIWVVQKPVGTAVPTLAHELYSHEYLAEQGKKSGHDQVGDPVDVDARESEAQATKNMLNSGVVTPADLAAARKARDA